MSLQVWLPLNGNLNQQGLSNITVTNNGATVDNNGKIGKCYRVSSDSRISFPSFGWMCMKPQYDFSFFCWAKGTTTGWMFACSAWEFRLRTDYLQVHLGGSGAYAARYTASFNDTTWYHVGFTWSGKNGKLTLYLNGNEVAHSDVPSSADFNISSIFNVPYDGPRYINDLRIYDHYLTPKEVKDISKGLVLHYALSNSMESSMRNLYSSPYSKGYTSAGTLNSDGSYNVKWSYTGNGSDSWWSMRYPTFSFTPGKTYMWMCKVKVNSCTPNVALEMRCSRMGNDWERPAVKTVVSASLVGKGWIEYYAFATLQATSNRAGTVYNTTPLLEFYTGTRKTASAVFSMDFDIKDVMICETATYVPYIDNGITGLVSDLSGYGNNGTVGGKILCDNTTPRYSNSYLFSTGSDYIQTGFSATMEQLSISFWVKPSASNGGYSIISCNYNNPTGGLWIATNCESSGVWAFRGAYMTASGLLTNDRWYHCVYTFDKGISKWYVNGENVALGRNTYTGTTLPMSNLTIGNSFTGTSWNTKRYGNISDYRLYATVLSADDILELYHTSAWVDCENTSCYEFTEG